MAWAQNWTGWNMGHLQTMPNWAWACVQGMDPTHGPGWKHGMFLIILYLILPTTLIPNMVGINYYWWWWWWVVEPY